MKTKVIKLDASNPDVAKITEAAQQIDSGALAAFPTETVYGIACSVNNESLSRLNSLKNRHPDKHYTLHVGQKTDIKKYIPAVGLRAQKLINKAWPGPLTIVFELENRQIEKQRKVLEPVVFENLYKDNSIGIRCPDNPIASILLQKTTKPVVAPSANITGKPPAVDADQVLACFSGQIELVLDAGPCKYKKSSTVVKIGKKGVEMLRPGLYSQADIDAISTVKFLFVCTGNICRSPMAEAIFRKYLAEKLRCKVDQLEKMGYKMLSAGVMDAPGMLASPEAVKACAAKGIDIKAHRSQTLSQLLIEESDFIFALGQMHRQHVAALSSNAAKKCLLLAANKDVPDPIGQSQQVYNDCANMIEKAVKERIGELVI
jgi:L-threonylcarbamoyladenylate synthase